MLQGIDQLTKQAHHLVAAGDLAGAHDLIGPALAAVDPKAGYLDPAVAEAAGLYARVLLALGEPQAARHWAALAHSAVAREYGSGDERSIAAAATLAAALHRVGSHARSAHLYRQVITELAAVDGPESLRVLAAQADLATVEHARGDCATARERLAYAWRLHHEVYGEGHPNGIRMLARLGAMERDCGRDADADGNLGLAEQLCRTHLPAGHPLAGQVAVLANSSGDAEHTCPDGPDEAVPTVGADAGAAPQAACEPLTEPVAEPAPDPGVPPGPPPRGPQPAADVHRDETAGTEPPWPPEPGWDPSPESVASPGQWPGVWQVGSAQPREWGDDKPDQPSFPSPPRDPRRPLPIVGTGLTVLLLLAVAAVAGVVLIGAAEPFSSAPSETPPTATPAAPTATPAAPTATPSATGAQPEPVAPGASPTGLALRDTRDAVQLTWIYPPGAEGPVVVSGGRHGQSPRALEELPAGTTSHTLYGLNPDLDYCFAVAVVYSTDRISHSDTVCTARRTTPRG